MVRRSLRSLRSPHFWWIATAFAICVVLHYPTRFHLPWDAGSLLGLQRHAMERILFLVPITYAASVFGIAGGTIALAAATAAMLPRVLFVSAFPRDALFETCTVIAVGVFINWWLEDRRKELGQREQALLKLESARRELQSYVQVIKENERRLSALHSVSTAVSQSLKLEEVLDLAAGKIKEAMDVDVVAIFLLDEEHRRLHLRAHRGMSEHFASQVDGLAVGEGFNGWVAQTGEPCFVEAAAEDPRLSREVVREERIQSLFVVPLQSKDRVVGTVCVGTRVRRQFQPAERRLLAVIGTELGVGVEKAFLFAELQRVGERFREVFEKAHDAIWIQDAQGRISDANQAAAALTGYEVAELIGRDVSPFFTPEGLKRAHQVQESLLAGEEIVQPYEQRIVRKSGSEAVLMTTTSLLGHEEARRFLNIARDITEARRLQEDLRLYADQTGRAHEEERKRIARELHDDTIQTLVAISRRLDNFVFGSRDMPKAAFEPLERLQREIDESLVRLRRFVQDLRPPTLEYLGLVPALRELTAQVQEQSGIRVDLLVQGSGHDFAPEEGLLIYRVVQEATRNVWKHSQATRAQIGLAFDDEQATIVVSDNGEGFELPGDSKLLQMGKLGLTGMKERAHLLGGGLEIVSAPGRGTTVTLKVPRRV